jgi:hypothetical protein
MHETIMGLRRALVINLKQHDNRRAEKPNCAFRRLSANTACAEKIPHATSALPASGAMDVRLSPKRVSAIVCQRLVEVGQKQNGLAKRAVFPAIVRVMRK